MKIKPMFAYQGGKSKVAKKIVEIIKNNHGKDFTFVDVCWGGCSVYVSEYYALSDDFVVLSNTKKGGISGDRVGTMVEYMSRV